MQAYFNPENMEGPQSRVGEECTVFNLFPFSCFCVCLYVYVCEGGCAMMCGAGQRRTCGSQFSASTISVLEVEL